MLTPILIVVPALVISALISGSETALLVVNKYRISQLASQGDRRARAVLALLSRPESMFGVILLFNTLVNILIAALIGTTVSGWVGGTSVLSVALATGIATVSIVVFSELLPKSIATATPLRWALAAAPVMRIVMTATGPLVYVLSLVPRAALNLLRMRQKIGSPTVTASELRMLVDIGEEQGEVEDAQGQMLENVFRFSEKTVADVMTPRTKIAWAQCDASVEDFLKVYIKHNHSRFPVWDGQHSDVVGIISSKDVLAQIAKGEFKKQIAGLMRQPLFVPEVQPLDELFATMRQSGAKIAIVLDEYASVSGLVTIASLVEQVVGNTGEEGQKPPQHYRRLAPDVSVVAGGMSIEDVRDKLNIKVPEGDYDTLAGWFLDLSQKVPFEGDSVSWEGIHLTAAKMDGNRIAQIVIKSR